MQNIGFSTEKTRTSWTILPVSRWQQTAKSVLPSSVALVTHTWLPQTTGDDQALPGIGVFQTTFSVSLHLSGKLVAAEQPLAVGPRNSGQLVESVGGVVRK